MLKNMVEMYSALTRLSHIYSLYKLYNNYNKYLLHLNFLFFVFDFFFTCVDFLFYLKRQDHQNNRPQDNSAYPFTITAKMN